MAFDIDTDVEVIAEYMKQYLIDTPKEKQLMRPALIGFLAYLIQQQTVYLNLEEDKSKHKHQIESLTDKQTSLLVRVRNMLD